MIISNEPYDPVGINVRTKAAEQRRTAQNYHRFMRGGDHIRAELKHALLFPDFHNGAKLFKYGKPTTPKLSTSKTQSPDKSLDYNFVNFKKQVFDQLDTPSPIRPNDSSSIEYAPKRKPRLALKYLKQDYEKKLKIDTSRTLDSNNQKSSVHNLLDQSYDFGLRQSIERDLDTIDPKQVDTSIGGAVGASSSRDTSLSSKIVKSSKKLQNLYNPEHSKQFKIPDLPKMHITTLSRKNNPTNVDNSISSLMIDGQSSRYFQNKTSSPVRISRSKRSIKEMNTTSTQGITQEKQNEQNKVQVSNTSKLLVTSAQFESMAEPSKPNHDTRKKNFSRGFKPKKVIRNNDYFPSFRQNRQNVQSKNTFVPIHSTNRSKGLNSRDSSLEKSIELGLSIQPSTSTGTGSKNLDKCLKTNGYKTIDYPQASMEKEVYRIRLPLLSQKQKLKQCYSKTENDEQ